MTQPHFNPQPTIEPYSARGVHHGPESLMDEKKMNILYPKTLEEKIALENEFNSLPLGSRDTPEKEARYHALA